MRGGGHRPPNHGIVRWAMPTLQLLLKYNRSLTGAARFSIYTKPPPHEGVSLWESLGATTMMSGSLLF